MPREVKRETVRCRANGGTLYDVTFRGQEPVKVEVVVAWQGAGNFNLRRIWIQGKPLTERSSAAVRAARLLQRQAGIAA